MRAIHCTTRARDPPATAAAAHCLHVGSTCEVRQHDKPTRPGCGCVHPQAPLLPALPHAATGGGGGRLGEDMRATTQTTRQGMVGRSAAAAYSTAHANWPAGLPKLRAARGLCCPATHLAGPAADFCKLGRQRGQSSHRAVRGEGTRRAGHGENAPVRRSDARGAMAMVAWPGKASAGTGTGIHLPVYVCYSAGSPPPQPP